MRTKRQIRQSRTASGFCVLPLLQQNRMLAEIKAPEWSMTSKGAVVSFVVPSIQEAQKICDEMKDEPWEMEIRKKRKKRSKNANDLLWEICTQIAIKISKGGAVVSKDDVYRRHIKESGVCDFVAVPQKAAEKLMQSWSKNGTGWFAEVVDFVPGKEISGCVKICLYYGSSVYDTEEMSRLLNSVLQDAESIGIQVMNESDRALIAQYPNGQ